MLMSVRKLPTISRAGRTFNAARNWWNSTSRTARLRTMATWTPRCIHQGPSATSPTWTTARKARKATASANSNQRNRSNASRSLARTSLASGSSNSHANASRSTQ